MRIERKTQQGYFFMYLQLNFEAEIYDMIVRLTFI